MSNRMANLDKIFFGAIIAAGIIVGMITNFPQLFIIFGLLLVLFAVVDFLLKASAGEVWLSLTACSLIFLFVASVTIFVHRLAT